MISELLVVCVVWFTLIHAGGVVRVLNAYYIYLIFH